ncbi:hypothetical protein [Nocardia sp. IFM 10818]
MRIQHARTTAARFAATTGEAWTDVTDRLTLARARTVWWAGRFAERHRAGDRAAPAAPLAAAPPFRAAGLREPVGAGRFH